MRAREKFASAASFENSTFAVAETDGARMSVNSLSLNALAAGIFERNKSVVFLTAGVASNYGLIHTLDQDLAVGRNATPAREGKRIFALKGNLPAADKAAALTDFLQGDHENTILYIDYLEPEELAVIMTHLARRAAPQGGAVTARIIIGSTVEEAQGIIDANKIHAAAMHIVAPDSKAGNFAKFGFARIETSRDWQPVPA